MKRDPRNVGSAGQLKGRVYLLTFMVAEKGDPWQRSEIEAVWRNLNLSKNWLERECAKWAAHQAQIGGPVSNVTFQQEGWGYETTFVDHIPLYKPEYNELRAMTEQAVKARGFADLASVSSWCREKRECDQVAVLFFLKKSSRSYAMPTDAVLQRYDSKKYNTECAFIYQPCLPGTICHELLHLFGAWDLYENDLQTKEHADAAVWLFFDSVMREPDPYQSKVIDPLTAWLVGISTEKKDYFEWFEPQY